jgi:hypothetical protein
MIDSSFQDKTAHADLVCPSQEMRFLEGLFCETTIPKAKRIGIGKLNNPRNEVDGDNDTR